MFIEELIEKLKSGSVLCWTRGGGLIQITSYSCHQCNPFRSKNRTWQRDGKFSSSGCDDELDLIAICRNPALIQKEFEQDTQRQPVVGDWVVWLVDNGTTLEKNEVVIIEHQYENGSYRLRGKKGTRNCFAGECFRFATPEEIAAAQQPEFRDGVYVSAAGYYITIKKVENGYEYTYNKGLKQTLCALENHYKFVAPMPPDDSELGVLRNGENGSSNYYYYFKIGESQDWGCAYHPLDYAAGIEKGWLYAFPKAEPAPPTQSSEQACSSLVMVCRGLETTKGTT